MKTRFLIIHLFLVLSAFGLKAQQAASLAKKFVLVKPNMTKIHAIQADKSYSLLYAYLVLNYKTQALNKVMEENCQFSQNFKNGIDYSQNECPVGMSSYKLGVPFIEIQELKELFRTLFRSDEYKWSKDGLSYTADSGAGGTFEYHKVKNKIVVKIMFVD